MNITLEMIVTDFTAGFPSIDISCAKLPQPLEGVRLFPKNLSTITDSFVYITEQYDHDIFFSIEKTVPVICFTSDPKLLSEFPNVITICLPLELAEGFNLVQQSYNHFVNWGKELDFAVFRDASFQELIDLSKDALPCPILVFDPALKLLAYAGAEYVKDDPIFLHATTNGYLDMETVHYFEEAKTFEQIKQEGTVYGHADSYRIHSDAVKAINIDNDLAVYCVMIHTDQFPGSYFNLLFEVLCDSFTALLKKQHVNFLKDRSVTDYFLMDILDNPDTPSEQIRERIAFNDLDYEGHYAVILLRSDIKRKSAEEYFIQYLRSNLTGCHVFPYKDYILILYVLPTSAFSAYKSFLNKQLKPIFEEFSGSNIEACVSKPFTSIAAFAEAYTQADHTFILEKKPEGKNDYLYFYDDYWVFDLFMQNAVKDKLFFYCEPCIADLISQNTQKAKQQLAILYEYLSNDRSSAAAAERLFMHRNNIVYHIKQLSEKYGLDLDDYEVRLKLLISFEMIKYDNKK